MNKTPHKTLDGEIILPTVQGGLVAPTETASTGDGAHTAYKVRPLPNGGKATEVTRYGEMLFGGVLMAGIMAAAAYGFATTQGPLGIVYVLLLLIGFFGSWMIFRAVLARRERARRARRAAKQNKLLH
jgi:hypothetical protein